MNRLFPKYTATEETFESQLEHVKQEIAEVEQADTDWLRCMETWDVIHACETLLDILDQRSRAYGMTDNVDMAYQMVIDKNERRGYYK